jgi:type II secretory pathway component PulJ
MRGHTAQQELVEAELSVARARAAVVEEERATNKRALAEAIAKGRELEKSYTTLERQFRQKEQAAIRKNLALSVVDGFIGQHIATKPDALSDFANEQEMAEWVTKGEELQRQRNALCAEARGLFGERERLRLEAVKALNALEQQRHAVRNCRNKIDDPNGEIAIKGWLGGVTAI